MDIDNINAVMDDYLNCMLYEETDGAVEWVSFFAESNHFKQPASRNSTLTDLQ